MSYESFASDESNSGGRTPPIKMNSESENIDHTEANGIIVHEIPEAGNEIEVQTSFETSDSVSVPIFSHNDILSGQTFDSVLANPSFDGKMDVTTVNPFFNYFGLDCTKNVEQVPSQSGDNTLFYSYRYPNALVVNGVPRTTVSYDFQFSDGKHAQRCRPHHLDVDHRSVGTSSAGVSTSNNIVAVSDEPMDALMRTQDARAYLDEIQNRYHHHPDVFKSFVDLIKPVRADKHELAELASLSTRVCELFHENPDLVERFIDFLAVDERPAARVAINKFRQCQYQQLPKSMPTVSMAGTTTASDLNTNGCTLDTNLKDYLSTSQSQKSAEVEIDNRSCVDDSKKRCLETTTENLINHNNDSTAKASSRRLRSTTLVNNVPLSKKYPDKYYYQQTKPHTTSSNDRITIANGQHDHGEYQQAINYVHKIKCRLSPEKYLQFLEILHSYQKQQRRKQESPSSYTNYSDKDVYIRISRLFQDHEDLLEEFIRYTPVSDEFLLSSHNNNNKQNVDIPTTSNAAAKLVRGDQSMPFVSPSRQEGTISHASIDVNPVLRTHSRLKLSRDDKTKNNTNLCGELGRFFEQTRQELFPSRYADLLRIFYLNNHDVISKSELAQATVLLLQNEPQLMKWCKRIIDSSNNVTKSHADVPKKSHMKTLRTPIYPEQKELLNVNEIDTSMWRRLDYSYCRIPAKYQLPMCSGRTLLCDEVLNDTWMSLPAWTEGAAYARKTTTTTSAEELMFRCEDERFELDLFIHANDAALKYLRQVQEKMNTMSEEEKSKFQLEECLGVRSSIHRAAIKRIYGEYASLKIIEGLKRHPSFTIPLVLKRLQLKDQQLKIDKKKRSQTWRKQMKNYSVNYLDCKKTDGNCMEENDKQDN